MMFCHDHSASKRDRDPISPPVACSKVAVGAVSSEYRELAKRAGG